jgi:hypothetical protein
MVFVHSTSAHARRYAVCYTLQGLQGPCGAAQPQCSLVFSLEGDNETMQPNFRGIRCQAGRLPWCVAVLGVEGWR